MTFAKEIVLKMIMEESQFNVNDPLVHLFSAKHQSYSPSDNLVDLKLEGEIKVIIRSALQTQKEEGIMPLCLVKSVLHWKAADRAITSPLEIIPCELKINKAEQTVTFVLLEEEAFINPFVLRKVEKEYDLTLSGDEDVQATIEKVTSLPIEEDHSKYYIGNFHHYRHEVLRELEQLLQQPFSTAVERILGNEEFTEQVIHLNEHDLFLSDTDQLKVFSTVEKGNTVIQGPPGTGKSQVLTNLISKIMFGNQSALVVSEKRVALEVIRKKLSQFDLDDFCYISTGETGTFDLINSLKDSWEKLERTENKNRIPELLNLSSQLEDQLQFTLDLIRNPQIFGGISYDQFREMSKGIDLDSIPFVNDLPDLNTWTTTEDQIQTIYSKGIHSALQYLHSSFIRSGTIQQVQQRLSIFLTHKEVLKSMSIHTWEDLHRAMKKAAFCQYFESPIFKKYQGVLTPGSKEQKKFISLYSKYIRVKTTLNGMNSLADNWITPPGLVETELLEKSLRDNSIFKRWKTERLWKKYSIQPLSSADELLKQRRKLLQEKGVFSKILVDFCGIGIDQESDIDLIHHQLQSLNTSDFGVWSQLTDEEKREYSKANNVLQDLYQTGKNILQLHSNDVINEVLTSVEKHSSTLVEEKEKLQSIPESIIRNLRAFPTFESLRSAVLKSNYTKTISGIPQLKIVDQKALITKVQQLLSDHKAEAELFADHLKQRRKETFEYYHQLLRIPAAKLSEEQKELKLIIKKGKSILVKQFSKTKSFPSIRELYHSEARIWIKCLKPIWMSNPSKIASTFPLEQQLFDFVIFDEASQIPLTNSIGALQRGNRIIIAGDSQQMGPSNYFKVQEEEPLDLLHQASFYCQNVMLKHHYRSEHPELIKFSNKYFYADELIAFPSPNEEKDPVQFHFLSDGVYDNRTNKREAEEVAKLISDLIKKEGSLGIVAFSEAQLECIYQQLDQKTKVLLEERIDNNSLFFKALENVQGEECDVLLVSFGYGYNEEKEFQMRFGPVNHKNGPRRLNVLFTRARKKIHWITSVKPSDFKISSNEGVELLRLYYNQPASSKKRTAHQFPYGLKPTVIQDKITIDGIHRYFSNARELSTFVAVCELRGWKLG
jgi:hypothetical protein